MMETHICKDGLYIETGFWMLQGMSAEVMKKMLL